MQLSLNFRGRGFVKMEKSDGVEERSGQMCCRSAPPGGGGGGKKTPLILVNSQHLALSLFLFSA